MASLASKVVVVLKEILMNAQQALQLVRSKFLEEERGITTGKVADQYRRACDEYPAQMTNAHYVWAREFTKALP
jgi:hypothetical protein